MPNTTNDTQAPVLSINNLHVLLPKGSERKYAVEAISYDLAPSEILCLVGESGSGKSLTARAVMGLLPAPYVEYEKGQIHFQGSDLTQVSESHLRRVRGGEISMIFQEPMTALNPVMRIGDQIDEVVRFHSKSSRKVRRQLALQLLSDVQLPDPPRILQAYPHELSGGQRQRAMIAMALALEPRVLIADEPTTALDVTTQAQILRLIKQLQAKHQTGVLFITHDFGVVADIADRVAVMQHGKIVEIGSADKVLNHPEHPYTQALIDAVPNLEPRAAKNVVDKPILEVRQLVKTFSSGGSWFGLGKPAKKVNACDHVDIVLNDAETLGIVGESGSGKSTLARCIVRLHESNSGDIIYRDQNLTKLDRAAMRPFRSKIQMVFQDPYASLNPRATVGRILTEGPVILGESAAEAKVRARDMLDLVGLDVKAFDRYPHEFSGGQRQRIGLARALTLQPEILVADEPVSALDVSIQAQVLELLADIRERLQLSMVFITHDLRVAAQVCDRIAVMRLGKVVEQGVTAQLFKQAQHPYTQELLDAVPGRAWSRRRSESP